MKARFDRDGFARLARQATLADGRGYRQLANIIGVTPTDLSRVCSARPAGIEKIFAVADWIGVEPRNFYAGPKHKRSKNKLLQSDQRETPEPCR